ncbi:MAG TPA: DNA/RNA nuclease SfsA [Deltaproteobacteria bacterium]|nr:DNA/RNA nuclease SfsA [Deltaproteobacteria bacterium]HPR54077.1 DNA/RNA nuclease SfsA [Deltaproteobacteria bacterium]HXK46857.1 DNA/RNA nuclease SfsA [Deltaproteobacteria bacterium]
MHDPLIIWPPLTRGTLVRRYKRFMADVALDDGTVITAHCPNSGRMLACSDPGNTVYLSLSASPGRKFPHTWELIEMPDTLVVVNTLRANQLARSAIERRFIPELSGYTSLKSEVRISDRSRIDLVLEGRGLEPCLVEVKSSTLVEQGMAMFPDAVTTRGLKHVRELQAMRHKGYRAVMLFIIQRTDAHSFAPAARIDPAYADGLKEACTDGVEALAYDTAIDLSGVTLGRNIPCIV